MKLIPLSKGYYTKVAKFSRKEMTLLSVPQVAECKIGLSWSNMGEVQL